MSTQPIVVIMRGISGAGKSTWAKENCGADAVICSADSFFVDADGVYQFDFTQLSDAHDACFDKYCEALDAGEYCVVVDNTNTTRAEITPYLMYARRRGYRVRIIHIDTPVDVAAARNVHGVPADGVAAQAARFEKMLPFEPKSEVVWVLDAKKRHADARREADRYAAPLFSRMMGADE